MGICGHIHYLVNLCVVSTSALQAKTTVDYTLIKETSSAGADMYTQRLKRRGDAAGK